VATIYHLIGIAAETTVPDLDGRQMAIMHGGAPIWGVIA
jgi:hypothetical protein